MKTLLLSALLWIGWTGTLGASEPNTLSAEEVKQGWRLLFNGKDTSAFKTFGKDTFPGQGWTVRDGMLVKMPDVRGGDIVTREVFGDFEFSWEWRLPRSGNNGVKYFILEERGKALGHEYQMIDEALIHDALSSTASFYLVVAPSPDKPLNPPGSWNHSRILVQGNQVSHWLNGRKVLEYQCGDPDILAQIQKTKFKGVEGFGLKQKGRILLTDHKDECHFRNLKIRTP